MTDDPTKGDPVVEDPLKDGSATQDPPPGEPGDKDGLPENLKGKTPEELAKMLADKDSQIGKMGTELGDLRTKSTKFEEDLNYLRGVEAIRRQQEEKKRQEELEAQRPQPKEKPWNYENPVETVREVVGEEAQKIQEQAFKTRVAENIGTAKEAFAEGQNAMKNPVDKNLYEGIEDQVRKAVFDYYAPALERGEDVSRFMRDPKAWKVAAQNIRLANDEIDRLKPDPDAAINPPAPVDTGIPGAPQGGGAPTGELDPEVKNIADQYGLSYKEAAEIIAKEAEIQGVRS